MPGSLCSRARIRAPRYSQDPLPCLSHVWARVPGRSPAHVEYRDTGLAVTTSCAPRLHWAHQTDPHCTDKETEAQESGATCPGSHSCPAWGPLPTLSLLTSAVSLFPASL